MKHLISKTALALVLAASSLALPTTASAKDVQVQIGPNGVKVVQPCDPNYDDCDFDRRSRSRGGYNDYNRGGYDDRGGDRGWDDDNRRWSDERPRWEDQDRYPRKVMRFCSDNRALDKAERMGLRRTHVAVSGKRFVEVRGRNRDGRRVTVSFGRSPNCPVMR